LPVLVEGATELTITARPTTSSTNLIVWAPCQPDQAVVFRHHADIVTSKDAH
jgi:hypothetical protein